MEIKSLSMSQQLRMMKGVEKYTSQKQGGTTAEAGESKSFGEFFKDKLEELNQVGLDSEKAIERAVEGKEPNPHATLLALQRAEISFSLMMSVKQKIERAYQEIIRTPIG